MIKYIIQFIFIYTISIWGCKIDSNSTKTQAPQHISSISTKPAPEFELVDLMGNKVRLSDYKDRYTVIHIATTWCPFCNAEAPHLEKLKNAYEDIAVLIIDVKEGRDLVKRKLADRFNLSFPVLLDEDGTVAASFAPEDILPELQRYEVMLASNLIIDPDGMIQYMSLLDSQNFDAELTDLRQVLDRLLKEENARKTMGFRLDVKPLEPIKVEETTTIESTFHIPNGLYTQAHEIANNALIPTNLSVKPLSGFWIGQPRYPEGAVLRISDTLRNSIYTGDIEIQIPIKAERVEAGTYYLRTSITYQACSNNQCYLPDIIKTHIPVQII